MHGTFEEPPTGLIPWFSKTEGILTILLLHHPLLFEETNASSRRSKKDFCRRCWGGLRSSQDIPSTHHKPISLAFTLFAICLSFSSPPLRPCRFIYPLSLSSLSICLLLPTCFLFACVLVCLLVTMAQDNTKLCDFTKYQQQ